MDACHFISYLSACSLITSYSPTKTEFEVKWMLCLALSMSRAQRNHLAPGQVIGDVVDPSATPRIVYGDKEVRDGTRLWQTDGENHPGARIEERNASTLYTLAYV